MRYKGARFLVTMLLFAAICTAAKKKNKEDFTQTLELPKDPPAVAVGDARRLTFQVSPLSSNGLLSQQVRDALKWILKVNGNSMIVHIRAFVAGSGDMRRVPQIVSDVLTEKRLPLPSVSVALAGALPLEGAQVVLEAVSVAKKDVNPGGVRFVAEEPEDSLGQEVERLITHLAGAQTLRVTCFVSSLEGAPGIAARFPGAALDLVQAHRLSLRPFAQCEAVARASDAGTQTLAFSGTRVAFGTEEKDAALAWQRLDRDLREAGVPTGSPGYVRIYQLNPAVGEMARKLRPGAATLVTIPIEGLASADAGFAIDAVAVLNK